MAARLAATRARTRTEHAHTQQASASTAGGSAAETHTCKSYSTGALPSSAFITSPLQSARTNNTLASGRVRHARPHILPHPSPRKLIWHARVTTRVTRSRAMITLARRITLHPVQEVRLPQCQVPWRGHATHDRITLQPSQRIVRAAGCAPSRTCTNRNTGPPPAAVGQPHARRRLEPAPHQHQG